MKILESIFVTGMTILFVSVPVHADPQINTHTQICVSEGGPQIECLCTATAIKNIGVDDEQYSRAVKTAQAIGHAAMMQIYQQAMSQNPPHQAGFDAVYQACLEKQDQQQ